MENTGFLVLVERGRAEGNWRPHFPLSHSLAQSMMAGSPVFLGIIVLLSAFLAPSVGSRAMPKLADRKLCADEECSCKPWGLGGLGSLGCQPVWRVLSFPSIPSPDPISMAVALQDYVAPDCRFLTIHRGQVVYVFSKLKGRGRLFWGGSVQGDYYGDLAARLGYFPSSVVREDQTLKPGKIDVKTDKWDFYCQ
uniref:melanoma-derived growth regulatory protein isoform X1 n=1 Tax=Nyctereutes procyonoides TaxID=34880 RepID=UPI0024438F18|nr:melanoma-derived growth regulatory protein isoform X1 [Nyctereutes procyonoides]